MFYSVDTTCNLLSLVITTDKRWNAFDWPEVRAEVKKWWWWQRAAACRWATRQHLIASDNDLPRPEFFPKNWK